MMATESGALVPPPRLRARKRRAPSTADDDVNDGCEYIHAAVGNGALPPSSPAAPTPFFTEAAYARFSAFGDDALAMLHGDAELQRTTCSTASSMTNSSLAVQRAASRPPPQASRQHLTQIIAERVKSTLGGVRSRNAAERMSALTILEHEEYMQLLQRRIDAQRSGVPLILALSAIEVDRWQVLHERVRSEQSELSRELLGITQREMGPVMSAVPAAVESWYERMMLQCRNDVFQMYPQHYEPAVLIERVAASAERCTMKHVKEVFSHGACPVVLDERFAPGLSIGLDALDASVSVATADAADGVARRAISADVHAEKLMDKFDCDVAMASSTLVALFDTDRSELSGKPPEWIIPMKSRVVVTQRGASKKHVYLDKPLPGAAVSAREKMATAGRAHVLAALQPAPPNAPGPPAPPTRGRTTYHVWELSSLRILVRCTTHAAVLVPSSSDGSSSSASEPRKPQSLSVFVKPDYRSFGLDEQITRSERLRFWIHSWLRGGSALAVGRLNPQSLVVNTWEKHSLASLVYGRDTQDAPEWFEPMESFEAVSQVLAAVCNVPAGTYLVKSPAPDRGGAVELLMAASRPVDVTASIDPRNDPRGASSGLFDLFEFISRPRDSNSVMDYVLPKWTYVRGRVPYCFHTGTYCVDFLLDGDCAKTNAGEPCRALHMRRGRVKGGARKDADWTFEDCSKAVKAAAKASDRATSLPPPPSRWLRPSFPFCRDAKSDNPMNVFAPMRCPKPSGKCALPHRTLHEIAEIVADSALHKKRDSTRTYKASYKKRVQGRKAPALPLPSRA